MIDAFVNGRLSADDHELMVHHISSCTECAGAVIAALAEAARALAADSADRAVNLGGEQVPLFDDSPEGARVHDLLQLDLILDRGDDNSAELLLRAERVEELSLEQLGEHPGADDTRFRRTNAGLPGLESPAESSLEVRQPDTVPAAASATDAALEEPLEVEVFSQVSREPDAADAEDEPVAFAADESEPVEIVAAELEPPGVEPLEAEAAEEVEPLEADAAAVESLQAEAEPLGGHARDVATDDRAPDGERAGIVEAIRDYTSEPRVRTRRWPLLAAAAASIVAFGALASFAAVQLRDFATLNDVEPRVAQAMTPSAIEAPSLAHDATPPSSVLAALLDSAAVGTVVHVDEGVASGVGHGVADSAVTAAAPTPAPDVVAGRSVGRGAPAAATASTPRRTVGAMQRANQPGSQPPEPAAVARAPAPRPSGSAAASDTARSSAADSTARRTPLPRLLRTTTHRARGDVDYVLREYEAAGPEPPPRPGINEFRWKNAAGTRLFVLSGPGTVAELRAYARWLRGL